MSQTEITAPVQSGGLASSGAQPRYGPALVIWVAAGLIALFQVSIIFSWLFASSNNARFSPSAPIILASVYSLWVPVVLAAVATFMNDQHRVLRDLAARSSTLGE